MSTTHSEQNQQKQPRLSVVPYLAMDNATAALAFYQQVFFRRRIAQRHGIHWRRKGSIGISRVAAFIVNAIGGDDYRAEVLAAIQVVNAF